MCLEAAFCKRQQLSCLENDRICMLPKGKEDKDEIQPLLSGPATPEGPYIQVSPKSLDVSCARESAGGFPAGPALKGTQPDRSLLYRNPRASCPCLRYWQICGLDPCPAVGNHWQHGSSHHLQEHIGTSHPWNSSGEKAGGRWSLLWNWTQRGCWKNMSIGETLRA